MMTDAQAEAAREKLAEYEAAKRAEARQAENDKRAAARASLAPLAATIPDLSASAAKVRTALDAGLGEERGLSDLARNVLIVINSLISRLERRTADTEPVPEPPAAPAP